MNDMHWCLVCGQRATELHHIVFRSQVKQLENCKLNHIYLCQEHHRGTQGVHGSKGHKLDGLLKLQFKNNLEILWDKQYLNREEIKEVLQIADKSLNRLLKSLILHKGKYFVEEVIRACMGGKLIIGGIENDS
ncbi:hypothetical protein ACQPU1_01420 [Clostridium paraputrificum]|uniref:hypothetical protein n=1 Tax=Clostridium paraputrificum TaxID=29363 RepID=UPI003D3452DF